MKKNILILFLLFGSVISLKTYADEPFVLAQGDGDPAEFTNFDLTEEDMAVVTPEGDFMVPTFLLPTIPPSITVHQNALASKKEEEKQEEDEEQEEEDDSVESAPEPAKIPAIVETKTPEPAPMVEEKKEPVSEITKEEESVLEIKEEKKEDKKEEKPIVKEEIPVEKTAAPVKLAEEKTQASEPEIKTQAPVIAEPVLKEEPVESFTEQPIYGMPKSFEPPQAIEPVQTETVLAEEQPEFNLKTRPKRKPEKTPMPAPRKRQLITSTYADEILKSYQEVGNRLTFKIPTELKVVFYRNATDISGQTMKWIKVFATQALRDSRLKVDIRVSTQSPEIQQARIALIEQILQDQGLTAHQIQISYSDRDPDSLVLSTRSTELLAQNIETKRRFGKKETKKIREW